MMRTMMRTTRLLLPLLLLASATSVVRARNDDDDGPLDNRDTCAHRVANCDPDEDHFQTKISLKHVSTVSRLEYRNTHVLLEQSWPTRGPWMKATHQKVVLVRCGCPLPALGDDYAEANVIFVPVSTVAVQMPNSLSKLYLMGQRPKVTAIESTRFLSEGTPELLTDVRDGTVRSLAKAPNGKPSTLIKLSFGAGTFSGSDAGFRLRLVDAGCTPSDVADCVLKETSCVYPAAADDDTAADERLNAALSELVTVPAYNDGGKTWILTKGEADRQPTTSLSYEIYFDSQLPQSVDLKGEAASCGNADLEINVERTVATDRRPIYYRLHDLPQGFPDVIIMEPRSLGSLADDDKVRARAFIDSDPGEESPLGRAELMKLTALVVGAEETGNGMFELIESRYERAKELAATAKHRPTVMVGKPGTWNEAARSSWMITVGSTYVGEFLRDANVEYRNADDSINDAVCGSGCGVCPSGTSDTRCSVPIDEYLELFRWADYWIGAGIGANCWSGSCNLSLDADALLDQNREIFSQFLPMRCGSVIALDKSHGAVGNSYWDVGRFRPDLILEDLVSLMHPDVDAEITGDTTFFRTLPPPTNAEGVGTCPRTLLPPTPAEGTVHVTASVALKGDPPADADRMGTPEFEILDRLYTKVNVAVAEKLGVGTNEVEVRMINDKDGSSSSTGFLFPLAVTVAVPNCDDAKCGIDVGRKMETDVADVVPEALGLSWITQADNHRAVVVTDDRGDVVPLADLLPEETKAPTKAPATTTKAPTAAPKVKDDADEEDEGECSGASATAALIRSAFLLAVSFASFALA